MEKEFSLEDGEKFVKLARKAIEYFAYTGKMYFAGCEEEKYKEKKGVFVTLNSFPEKELLGCIGLPYPVKPLWDAIIDAATSAAFNDPRFMQVRASKFDKIVIEVSILTDPEIVKKENVLNAIEVGKHGLIVKKGSKSGLLLPQVAVTEKWNAETFLKYCCEKAGLIPSAWKQKETKIFRFQVQVFAEESPNGTVKEVDLK